ncbi:MAG: hypothetical protein KDA85_15830, partial [Planctomycetaceae bacterium]|nr:hypothetical protein [Planctomycetaceae bacterium]
DLLLTGVEGASVGSWEELAKVSREIGFSRVAEQISGLSDNLATRMNSVRWDGSSAARRALELCLLVRVLMEL